MIAILGAMQAEVDSLIREIKDVKIENVSGYDFARGTIGSHEVVVARCGVGKVNAAVCCQTLIMTYHPEVIINSGAAGSLSPELDILDVAVATDAVQHDYDTTAFGDPKGLICFANEQRVDIPANPELCQKLLKACEALKDTTVLQGRIATGDQFISDTEKRLALGKEFSALACEMEGGAVGHTCYRNNVPFAILRCISDDLTNSTSMDYEAFKAFAAAKTTAVLDRFSQQI